MVFGSCWSASSSGASLVKSEIGSIQGGQGETKKEAGHSRLVGGSFIKQGNLCTRLVLGHCKMTRSLHLPAIILSLYKDLNFTYTIQSYIPSRWAQHYNIISSLCPWGILWGREGKQNSHSKDRGSEEPLAARVQLTGEPAVMSSQ